MTNEVECHRTITKSVEEIFIQCLKRCLYCKQTTKKRCSRCKWAYYCCRDHQRTHWNYSTSPVTPGIGHKYVCEKPFGPLFRDTPLVCAFLGKYTPAWRTKTALEYVIRYRRLVGSHENHIAVIEWALQQAQLRPEGFIESVYLFYATLFNAENGEGIKIARLLLRYNVTPNEWMLRWNPGTYHYVGTNEARDDIINIIHKANRRRLCMERETARLGWRPWTHQRYARAYRDTLRTLVVLAKAPRVSEEL